RASRGELMEEDRDHALPLVRTLARAVGVRDAEGDRVESVLAAEVAQIALDRKLADGIGRDRPRRELLVHEVDVLVAVDRASRRAEEDAVDPRLDRELEKLDAREHVRPHV